MRDLECTTAHHIFILFREKAQHYTYIYRNNYNLLLPSEIMLFIRQESLCTSSTSMYTRRRCKTD